MSREPLSGMARGPPSFATHLDSTIDEPFLPISNHDDVRLTPFRATDVEAMVELCNIHSVGRWFYHRAFPYAASDFQQEQDKIASEQDDAIAALKSGERPKSYPFKVIREVKTGKLIGEIRIFPSQEHPPSEEVWELSYILHPDHQGRGIARAAVNECIEWGRAVLDVKKLEAYVQPENKRSTKLLDKLNFGLLDTVTGPWPEEKGGGMSTAGRYMKEL